MGNVKIKMVAIMITICIAMQLTCAPGNIVKEEEQPEIKATNEWIYTIDDINDKEAILLRS